MYCRHLASALLFLFLASACGRKEPARIKQLAIVPFDNLTSDSGRNWLGRAVVTAIAYDLESAPDVHSQVVDSVSAASSISASQALEGYLSVVQGRLKLNAVLEDFPHAKAVASYEFTGPESEGVLPLLNQLAKRVSAGARLFPTSNTDAFRLYGEALAAARDKDQAAHAFESATQADPKFTPAYAGWAESLLAAGDRAGGLAVLDRARRVTQDPIDRAELDALVANITADRTAQMSALTELARLSPANGKTLSDLATLQFGQRKFRDAAQTYESALRVTPDDPSLWNELGYAYAFGQDLPNARRAIGRYVQLAPGDANALDSLGEINFYLGDFAAAEKAFLDAEKNHSVNGGAEMIKAAEAHLMTGDLAGADAIFGKYLAMAQPSQRPLASYQQAQWEFLTGRRKQAFTRIQQAIQTLSGDGQVVAQTQLAFWKLETGDAKAAADLADRAAASAASPQAHALADSVRVFAGEHAANVPRATAALALLFTHKYEEALPLLEATYRETASASDGDVRTLLAWTYVQLGRVDAARDLVATYPIPAFSGDSLFASLMFPRFLYVRGAVLEKEGKRAEAKQSYELYLKYAGDVPDVFGDEPKVRAAVSKL